jgi:alkenylglycerophosphocholine/alkenylglycerophosphoethanolamine hydrolase
LPHFAIVICVSMLFHWTYFISVLIPTTTLSIYSKLCKRDLYPLFKPLPVIFLLSASLVIRLDVIFHNHFFLFVALGQVFGLIGDILLLYGRFLLFGLVAFLVGHVLYTVGFALAVSWVIPPLVSLGFVFVLACYCVMLWHVFADQKMLRIASIIYTIVICVMLLWAVNFELVLRREFPYAAVGALLFCISDSIIAWNMLHREECHLTEAAVLVTYYAAQGLIAWGTFFSPPSTFIQDS